MVQIMHCFKNFVGWGLNRIFRMNKWCFLDNESTKCSYFCDVDMKCITHTNLFTSLKNKMMVDSIFMRIMFCKFIAFRPKNSCESLLLLIYYIMPTTILHYICNFWLVKKTSQEFKILNPDDVSLDPCTGPVIIAHKSMISIHVTWLL